jgi:CobQ-like glutamine amidotransferase family enzyme
VSKKGSITILQLYPNEMNIYGDYGNLLTLKRRAEWHGYEVEVAYHHPGKVLPVNADIIVGGGGQDSGQDVVGPDLLRNAELLRDMVDDGMPMLMICGLYQLFGHRFVTSDHTIEGIGIFDIETFAGPKRLIGNIVTRSDIFGEIIGYENHSGLTHLLNDQKSFGIVTKGAGNNGQDKTEGAIVHNAIGTYLHGSLLPKNPNVADHLIETAIMRKYGDFNPEIIDDTFATRARTIAKKRPR